MKKLFAVIFIFIATLSVHGQNKEKIKTGWNFGPLPAVSYNSDLGFQYGALCDIFYFGDGSTYPTYLHKFNVELSHYTKGETIAHMFYDSKFLLPGLRVTAALSYLESAMSPFYGFNGYASPLNTDLTKNSSYYYMDRSMLRGIADLQGNIFNNLAWMAGLTFWNVSTGDVQLEKYKNELSLYEQYVASGLIKENEISGTHIEFKGGLVYDTRDMEAAPTKGYCAEVVASLSPALFGDAEAYGRIMASWRQFFPILKDNLVLGYRLNYQQTFGNAPFYLQQTITPLYLRQIKNEGLGGKNSVRGILQNRILGDGYAWANIEARIKIARFSLINQNWYVALNPFVDMGIITDDRKFEEQSNKENELLGLYSGEDYNDIHVSAGMGLKLVMNHNFIISVEYGKPFDKRDGKGSLNIGTNYIF
ncbi:MAG: BamA/TamA family outer membrane protein [Bacteroidaceae bacterium]|nr:BamA/TamA family outer membrane protein [Bacteroidaceae bacterium]